MNAVIVPAPKSEEDTAKKSGLRIPRWSELHGIGNSGISKATMLIPFIGYMIIFNEKLIRYFELSSIFVWQGDERVSYRFFFFYFGLSSLGIGSIMFMIFCPQEVKNYPKLEDYVEKEKSIGSRFRLQRLAEKTLREMRHVKKQIGETNEYMAEVEREFSLRDQDIHQMKNPMLKGEEFDHNEMYNEFLKLKWWIRNRKFPRIRKLISVFYVSGFIVIIIPTIDTFFGYATRSTEIG